VVVARRLLAVPLRVEHLPEGRRDGAHPRTHGVRFDARVVQIKDYAGCSGINRCLFCMGISNKYCVLW
jgi:hypothetical protein